MSNLNVIADFVSKINVACRGHFVSIAVRRTKLIISLLKLFYNYGVIRGFVIYDKSIVVFLKYHIFLVMRFKKL